VLGLRRTAGDDAVAHLGRAGLRDGLLALADDSFRTVAVLALGLLANRPKHTLQVLDLLLALRDVLLDHRLQLQVGRFRMHHVLGFEELVLGVVQVGQLVDKHLPSALHRHRVSSPPREFRAGFCKRLQ